MEEQSTPQWDRQRLCALWWLTVEIVRTGKGKKGALQKKKKKVLFSISYYIDVG